jgi:hypothetical protein
MFQPRGIILTARVMPSKSVSSAAETLAKSHDRNFGFCPANSQLYRGSAKLSQDNHGIDRFSLLADGR